MMASTSDSTPPPSVAVPASSAASAAPERPSVKIDVNGLSFFYGG